MSSVYPVPGPEMLIDTVDLHDRSVGVIPRHDALPLGQNFRVAHLFLFNTNGDLLIQQLASSRDRHPLAWGSSVATYLFAGEHYDEAIERRAFQELGLRLPHVKEIGRTMMEDSNSEKFIALFEACSDGPFSVDESHIQRVEFLPVREIAALMGTGRLFTPTFRHLFSFYRTVVKSV